MHREELVVGARIEHAGAGRRELDADEQRLEPTDDEEAQPEQGVEEADVLVVDGPKRARRREGGSVERRGDGAHFRLSR